MNAAQLAAYLLWLSGITLPVVEDIYLGGSVSPNFGLLRWFGTVAELRAAQPPASNIPVMLAGYNAVGDMSPKVYIYNLTDNRTDDGGSVIKPNAIVTLGRWNLVQ